MFAPMPLTIAALAVAALAACGTTTSPTGPTAPAADVQLVSMLERAIQDEYRAEAIYEGVLVDFGQVAPFVNVLIAEERHSAAIGRLFTSRGLAVPASGSSVASVPHFGTVAAACGAGTLAERANIALYDELLRGELPADVRQVFTNNRSASLLNHLPAFSRCA